MAKKKRNGDAGKLRPISMNELTPETRLAIGVGQLVLDYALSKFLPQEAGKKGKAEVGMGELADEMRKRIKRAVDAELRVQKPTPKRRR